MKPLPWVASPGASIASSPAACALAECKDAMEAKQIADVAEAARVYLERTQASVETVNRATEVRLLAERQMGEFLKTMPKNEGMKGSVVSGSTREPVRDETPTLASIGISKKQSSVAQKLADIPADEFKARIAITKIDGGKLSTAGANQKCRNARPIYATGSRSGRLGHRTGAASPLDG